MERPAITDCAEKRLKSGPFGIHLDRIIQLTLDEAARGYPITTIRLHVWLLTSFGEWLSFRGLALNNIRPNTIEEFLAFRFGTNDARHNGAKVLPLLIEQVAGIERTRRRPTFIDQVVASYCRFLDHERGLANTTIRNYSLMVWRFLAHRFGVDPPGPPTLACIEPSDVVAFTIQYAPTLSHKRVLLLASALRSFFQYLVLTGQTEVNLGGAVQKVANWRDNNIPGALAPNEIRQLLSTCNRKTPVGRRDYAILLLLYRLGLRAGEVVNLTLEAIDWEAGEILLFGKSRRVDRLPLPHDVGKAIAAYLRQDRPLCQNRRLFLRIRAPHSGLQTSGAISDTIRRALKRAGMPTLKAGAHLFRHSLARAMLRRGASLSEIGQVLRHQGVDTTAIYAKVDLDSLRLVSLPWPGH